MSTDIRVQYDKVYKYCYFKVSNAELAEDLTQETFLKYFSQENYLERGKQLAYLYTIAKNLCIDTYRKKKYAELSTEIQGEDQIEKLELKIAVRQSLEKLSEQEQELVFLRYINQLSVGEVASITGMSRFAVYRKLNKALSALKEILRKEDFYG